MHAFRVETRSRPAFLVDADTWSDEQLWDDQGRVVGAARRFRRGDAVVLTLAPSEVRACAEVDVDAAVLAAAAAALELERAATR